MVQLGAEFRREVDHRLRTLDVDAVVDGVARGHVVNGAEMQDRIGGGRFTVDPEGGGGEVTVQGDHSIITIAAAPLVEFPGDPRPHQGVHHGVGVAVQQSGHDPAAQESGCSGDQVGIHIQLLKRANGHLTCE
ncbi:hypothetical protein TPAU25S_01056 [Tsukamurella paurometabola]